jgi:hypothetical protein
MLMALRNDRIIMESKMALLKLTYEQTHPMQQPEGLLHKASYNVDVDSDVSRTDNFALVFGTRMYMQRHSIQLSPRGY